MWLAPAVRRLWCGRDGPRRAELERRRRRRRGRDVVGRCRSTAGPVVLQPPHAAVADRGLSRRRRGAVAAVGEGGAAPVAGRGGGGAAGRGGAPGVRTARVVAVDGRNGAVHRHQRRRRDPADARRTGRRAAAAVQQVRAVPANFLM